MVNDVKKGTSAHHITRDMVRTMKVISQVDAKFLLCIAGRTLVLVDQHAADERRRLELFHQNIDAYIEKGILEPPVVMDLTSIEARYSFLALKLSAAGLYV